MYKRQARSLTATSSCGLAYMWEELYIAASNRLPLALASFQCGRTGFCYAYIYKIADTVISAVEHHHFILLCTAE